MSVQVRHKFASAGAGTQLTATYDETTPLDANHGHVLLVRSQAGSSVVVNAPPTPAGFTPIFTPTIAQSGAFTVREDWFRARGNGTINSAVVTATASIVRHASLWAIDGVTKDDFENTATFVSATGSTNVTSRTITIPAASVSNVVNLVGLALSAGNGSTTGFSWVEDGATVAFAGSSSTSTFSTRHENVGSPSAQTYATNPWTTAGLAALSGASFGGSVPAPVIQFTEYDTVAVRDFRGSTSSSGAVTHSISPTTNTFEPEEGLFLIYQTNAVQYFTVTSTAPSATPVNTAITIPAYPSDASGLEILIKEGGALTPL